VLVFTNGEVELSYRSEAGWAKNDLTAAAGGAPPAGGDPQEAASVPDGCGLRLYLTLAYISRY
jgi:hypothetical protein